jgi:hypothetical protein
LKKVRNDQTRGREAEIHQGSEHSDLTETHFQVFLYPNQGCGYNSIIVVQKEISQYELAKNEPSRPPVYVLFVEIGFLFYPVQTPLGVVLVCPFPCELRLPATACRFEIFKAVYDDLRAVVLSLVVHF